MRRPSKAPRLLYFVVLGSALFWAACSDGGPGPSEPALDPDFDVIQLSVDDLEPALRAQARFNHEVLDVPGVVGTAVGPDRAGRASLQILVARDNMRALPTTLGGVPVTVLVTGEIRALGQVGPQAKPTCGKRGLPECPPDGEDPPGLNERHPRPVPIGVSTGHPDITAGTIGARVTNGTGVFALSNNHVYANENLADVGDDVIQPGTFDGGTSPADDIGTLADFEPIVFESCAAGGANTMDAAIAATTTGDLGNSTPAGVGYGTPKSTTIAAAPNMRVKKVGRTTGFTKGTITGVSATVNVGYDTGTACFVNQIITTNISAGGDSGSLVVADGKGRDKSADRKPVGLLFAGSSSVTILNPIDPVLQRFGVTIDGN